MTPRDALVPDSVRDSVLTAVTHVRGTLARIVFTRALLQALGAGLVTWLLLALLAPWLETHRQNSSPLALVMAIVVTLTSLAILAWRRGAVTPLRAALWMEEHESTGYALVTWVEQSLIVPPPPPSSSSRSLQRLVAQASQASLARARHRLGSLARSQLAGPFLFVIGATVIAGLSVRGTSAVSGNAIPRRSGTSSSAGRRVLPIGAWRVRVTPPAYTGRPAQSLGDVTDLRALSGTRIELLGSGAAPDSIRAHSPGDSAVVLRQVALELLVNGWKSAVIATASPLAVRVSRDRFARLLLIEGIGDSVPRVALTAPVRDSVLRRAEGHLPLVATIHDDIGVSRAFFDVVISSGEGERFTVRTMHVGARLLDGQRDVMLRWSLDLRAMQLSPGDVVHLRAIARDAHPAAGREGGTSETRSFRIARASEYDSIAVEPAPPPEVDHSLLSQRMLLMLTERLEQGQPRLTLPVVRDESANLARDQARLRQAVGDAVFQRLTGDAGGEHSHFANDGHDHGVEAVGGKLALSGVNAQGMLEEGDDAPVMAINKPLLEAYNAMWDAGRALEQAEPRAAIPFMRLALAAIERARAASRLYLRGRPPTVIIDIAKVRLTGRDTGAPGDRAGRTALLARSTAREARLLAAALLMTSDAQAARDSLAVLRLESLADAPAFAEALSSLLEVFRRGTGADATESFLRARRVLGGIVRVPATGWSRGGPP